MKHQPSTLALGIVIGVLASAVVALGVGAGRQPVAGPPTPPLDLLRAKKIEVVNDDGKVVVTIGSEMNEGSLTLNGRREDDVFMVTSLGGGFAMAGRNRSGSIVFAVHADGDDAGSLSLFNKQQEALATVNLAHPLTETRGSNVQMCAAPANGFVFVLSPEGLGYSVGPGGGTTPTYLDLGPNAENFIVPNFLDRNKNIIRKSKEPKP